MVNFPSSKLYQANKETKMPLSMIKAGERARVLNVSGADTVRKHLGSLGVVAGAVVAVHQVMGGNMIIGVHDSRLAINDDLARRIMVEVI
jgi:ferrous iron transport protein A